MESNREKRDREEKDKKRGQNIGCVVAIIAIAFVSYVFYVSSSGSSEPKPNTREAEQICETAIEPHLKTPSTAEYESRVQVHESIENDYRIVTQVDSQNGFGAMVRTEFYCNMTWLPESKDWRLDKVSNN